VKKVVLTGSESTGKTELAHRLGAHFGAPVAEEFVRRYAAERGGQLGFADHGPIAKGQIASENAAMANANDLVILDTDLVSTAVYCDHYFGRCPLWIEATALERVADLYLLLKPDIPWLADGVRDRGERREEMHELFRAKLQALGANFVEIGGDRESRFESARRAIEAIRS
jgi:NadR type nicotinamide-nucleotide adenylyltransferase